ncbi:hypothetical protein CO131_00380 [Candidatus Kaiserbacteria bacterium CG_4_9_14_3_um_filter_50_16]|uniref:Response regulatory domain-containing protein n=1 Tax=Candidatus Kaiserbacteria bacterium CG08_land_8_20_14_0_20_50_21 TaxID=1974604 RepID=A0A2H0YYT8_9BACT|nr:MAG: hypothetical protein AUJ45_02750 [Parcubacteria group bacterium CG1_02_50_68]PIS43647.1 MAG: hypothetical protein COT23_00150 [Candidatus Kaiserbacteria bacterium CG08_land_8_20_14_0_20_50_21]PIU81772.1 MAG: hypothetical protein COS69_02400 [Candidatus Kaiserbacteria bacterium CG06_land_8_20_14_3_00_49_31]PIW96510.1 MAG: hypothetical protein COZ83_00415 [Candidatus Kaiserbacteria bacterium CG_4_8_14_3_um_filter_50_23]PJA94642.1 MAG: hypothetical protein CO131_00380 [Candidatus Kaiserbac
MSKKIFIVEDDQTLRNVLLEKFSKSGYAVEEAEDGEIALQKLRGGLKPDLILLDVLMPKKNGMEVLREMSTDPALKDIPVIIISNSGQPVEVELAKKLGAKDFLIKAIFDPAEVLEKVQALLQENGHSKATEEAAQLPIIDQDMKGKGVLVVEDDKFLRNLFIHKLFSSGLKVESAIDAKGAFGILENWKPDIILLDLILPGIDGFEILSRLKKDERLASIPVIILSNLGEKKDIDRAMSLGAQEFMVKVNFNLEEIISHVQRVLSNVQK